MSRGTQPNGTRKTRRARRMRHTRRLNFLANRLAVAASQVVVRLAEEGPDALHHPVAPSSPRHHPRVPPSSPLVAALPACRHVPRVHGPRGEHFRELVGEGGLWAPVDRVPVAHTTGVAGGGKAHSAAVRTGAVGTAAVRTADSKAKSTEQYHGARAICRPQGYCERQHVERAKCAQGDNRQAGTNLETSCRTWWTCGWHTRCRCHRKYSSYSRLPISCQFYPRFARTSSSASSSAVSMYRNMLAAFNVCSYLIADGTSMRLSSRTPLILENIRTRRFRSSCLSKAKRRSQRYPLRLHTLCGFGTRFSGGTTLRAPSNHPDNGGGCPLRCNVGELVREVFRGLAWVGTILCAATENCLDSPGCSRRPDGNRHCQIPAIYKQWDRLKST